MFKKSMIGCLGLLVCSLHAGELRKTPADDLSCTGMNKVILKETLVVLYKKTMDVLNGAQTQKSLDRAIRAFVLQARKFGLAYVTRDEVTGIELRFDPAFDEQGTRAWRYLLHTRAMRGEIITLNEKYAQISADCDVFSRY